MSIKKNDIMPRPGVTPPNKIVAIILFFALGLFLLSFMFRKMTSDVMPKPSTSHFGVMSLEGDVALNTKSQLADTMRRMRAAATKGDIDAVARMLQQGFKVDQDLGRHTTMLMLAAMHNQTKMVRFLVQHHAEISAQDAEGKNALIFAAEQGNTEQMLYLLSHCKDININSLYELPAGETNSQFHEVRKVGKSLLHVAVEHGRVPLARALIKLHADVNVRDGYHSTPLTFAASNGDTDMVKFLVSQHAHVNAGSDGKNTPLAYARMNHHADIVKILVEAGATQ